MWTHTYQYPKSSFLSIEKDMQIISGWILKNNSLKKLLYYTDKDCLHKPNLSDEQSASLFGANIKMVPKLQVDDTIRNYLFISFDDFLTNGNNPEFRDNTIEVDILCHFDQWELGDFQLRPYRIAAEIDSMLHKNYLTGIGKVQFLGASQLLLNNEFGGLCLLYRVVHGEEDKKDAPRPGDQERINQNFDEIFNHPQD